MDLIQIWYYVTKHGGDYYLKPLFNKSKNMWIWIYFLKTWCPDDILGTTDVLIKLMGYTFDVSKLQTCDFFVKEIIAKYPLLTISFKILFLFFSPHFYLLPLQKDLTNTFIRKCVL